MLFRNIKHGVRGTLISLFFLVMPAIGSADSFMGRASLEGYDSWDWSGFEARILIEDKPVSLPVPLIDDGSFELHNLAHIPSDRGIVEVFSERYILRGRLSDQPIIVSPMSTASLALDIEANSRLLDARGVKPSSEAKLTAIANAIHSVFYSQVASPKKLEASPILLSRYSDTWSLAQHLSRYPQHLIGYQVKYHDELAVSHHSMKGKHKLNINTPLNIEQSLMLRLDSQGRPLRWQYLEFNEAPWACVDYFEKRIRWPLGVRLWAVDPSLASHYNLIQAGTNIDELIRDNHCGNTNWRLPTVQEMMSLIDSDSGAWRFPLSLPVSGLGPYWVQGDQGEPQVLDLVTKEINESTEAAKLLPIAFTADAPPPTAVRDTTPVNLVQLRNAYSQPSGKWPKATLDEGVPFKELASLPPVAFPQNNPYSPEKVRLGKALFFDKNLSKQRNIACSSCHIPDQHWGDGRKLSPGTDGKNGRRNAMPILNVAYNTSQFWDGRVGSLEEQSIHPIVDQLEMALTLDELLDRLKADSQYPALFASAFGDSEISLDRFKQAVATFERSLISKPSDFDRFLSGDQQAMTDQQIWGLHLFRTKARCANCHSGPTLSDQSFRNTGLTYYGRRLEDVGRFTLDYRHESMGAFRVPPLRDIAFTAPYMHNGVFPTLATETKSGAVVGVLAMYNAGMTKGRNANYPQYATKYDPFFPVVDDLIQPLGLSNEELLALDAFLKSVSAASRLTPASIDVLQNPSIER
ncbi:hypothetical protein HF888_05550 [Bermanella marisrubri]|uniref:Methylamine utilization protein MauG n=1 Tax=Bermanella marisrubri TaxID=207949 RepID=Q1MY71_9GAMM|nr:cytochrome c peroxidase [Bermanella marisrubri]EAT10939.1 cytochrome-c peroxidase [Oceanobacter sp. RED65] [Bermanella marisrubri]QIZ83718.1 hypothetical protein HF888_05550 [Bermanella marisrubri]